MTIEAVLAYYAHMDDAPEGAESEAAIVQHADSAGFQFTEAELRAVRQTGKALAQMRRDSALRNEILSADSPAAALLEVARASGYDLDRLALYALLEPRREPGDELDAPALEGVTGGARSQFLPEIGDEVVVSFLGGDVSRPIVIGALWNDASKPPAQD